MTKFAFAKGRLYFETVFVKAPILVLKSDYFELEKLVLIENNNHLQQRRV